MLRSRSTRLHEIVISCADAKSFTAQEAQTISLVSTCGCMLRTPQLWVTAQYCLRHKALAPQELQLLAPFPLHPNWGSASERLPGGELTCPPHYSLTGLGTPPSQQSKSKLDHQQTTSVNNKQTGGNESRPKGERYRGKEI